MKVKEIIEKLCSHEISKQEALEQIEKITKRLRKNGAIEFNVEEVSYSGESKHGYLKLKLPYQYSKIEKKINPGDKVDVVILP